MLIKDTGGNFTDVLGNMPIVDTRWMTRKMVVCWRYKSMERRIWRTLNHCRDAHMQMLTGGEWVRKHDFMRRDRK